MFVCWVVVAFFFFFGGGGGFRGMGQGQLVGLFGWVLSPSSPFPLPPYHSELEM